MDRVIKTGRLLLYALFLSLIIGLVNLRGSALLWSFMVIVFGARLYEVFNPAAELFSHRHREHGPPRWVSWLVGLSFITNLILPILDFRYRGEVFWTSPLPAAPWWSWLGLMIFAAGAAMRIRALHAAALQLKIVPKIEAKSKTAKAEKEKPVVVSHEEVVPIRRDFEIGTVVSAVGVAVLFTSLWALIAVLLVVLPASLYYLRKKTAVLQETTAV